MCVFYVFLCVFPICLVGCVCYTNRYVVLDNCFRYHMIVVTPVRCVAAYGEYVLFIFFADLDRFLPDLVRGRVLTGRCVDWSASDDGSERVRVRVFGLEASQLTLCIDDSRKQGVIRPRRAVYFLVASSLPARYLSLSRTTASYTKKERSTAVLLYCCNE